MNTKKNYYYSKIANFKITAHLLKKRNNTFYVTQYYNRGHSLNFTISKESKYKTKIHQKTKKIKIKIKVLVGVLVGNFTPKIERS